MTLSAVELAAARAAQESLMVHTCTIKRDTVVRNVYGGATETPATVSTSLCRLAPATQSDRQLAGMAIEGAAWTVTVPYSTDVRVSDRIEVNGLTLEVNHVIGGHTIETGRRVVTVQR